MNKSRKYYSKVLLFGEYTTILGSKALAIPYDQFSGEWYYTKGNEGQKDLLTAFLNYAITLDQLSIKKEAFLADLENGLYFRSNIPIGYGLGSSGAFTAAFFDQYVINSDGYDTKALKEVLATLESYFHGKSSGTDPLVSLLNMPIIIHQDKSVELLFSDYDLSWHQFELINSNQARSTEPWVKRFLKQREEDEIFKNKTAVLSELNDQVIEASLNKDEDQFKQCLKAISHIQLHHMSEWIPDHIKDVWSTDQNAVMKLCGAGGGGFFLRINV